MPEALLGPVLGAELLAAMRLSIGNIQEAVRTGEAKNAAPELMRFVDRLLPGPELVEYSRRST